MCGIHYILSSSENKTKVLDTMVESSTHRGPDNHGLSYGKFKNYFFGLGHNHLAIVGDSTAKQPLTSHKYHFAINGEIYNYIALANKYEVKNRLTDSHVLFELLQKHGLSILAEVRGMYAFVLVDLIHNKTFIGRDIFGQKPLYYAQHETNLFVSSENKALHAVLSIQKKIDITQIRNILTYKFVQATRTVYEGIQEVPAGTVLEMVGTTIHRSHTIKSKRSLNFTLADTIRNTVDIHSTSGSALLLSGGLDSSILLHEMRELGKAPVSYTMNTSIGSRFDTQDLQYARKLTTEYNTKHVEVSARPELFNSFIHSMDSPIGDSAFFCNWVLSKEIAKNHKFVLGGAGADELFGGYNRPIIYDKYLSNKNFFVLLSKFKGLLRLLPNSPRKRQLHKLLHAIEKNEKATYYNFIALNFELQKQSFPDNPFSLEDALALDIKQYLQQDVLKLSDQSGMAHSLEVRNPFLDNEVYHWSKSITAKDKIKQNGKHALKQAYSNVELLKPIINRQKEGFGLPFIGFFGEEKWRFLTQKMEVLKPYVSLQELSSIQRVVQHKSDIFSNEYWTLLILISWLDR